MLTQFNCEPIGIIHTQKYVKFDTPHQPTDGKEETNIIELFPGKRFEVALRDLDGFERIWIIWWFNKNQNWRPLVNPPRGSGKKRGVFATRSPHRPCPIGITSVPLISISGRKLIVGNVDLLDRTPILDIKPYIVEVDSFSNQKQGWLDEESLILDKPPTFSVSLDQVAHRQLSWLKDNWNVDFFPKVKHILERSPEKSRTNRITSVKNGIARLSSGAWRVFFSISGHNVEIQKIGVGYPIELLTKEGFEIIPDWEAQIEFLKEWENLKTN
jgi:tRNA-Thr(GGU) m(6)t(6)A37 methyltransferase TsaA